MTDEPGDAVFEPIRTMIRRELVERALPSLAVGVARGGTIVWEEGFGWADRERRVEATPHTLYSLASISKPITATGLMVLVERELIDLDHPIDEYLGDAKLNARTGKAAEATVRRVANHTAGLPLHYQFFYADEPYHRPPMDETIRRYANLVTPPGERWMYSNLGYGLLDYVIERLGRRSYAEWMRREVFLPLGMLHASVGIGPGLEAFAAQRYGADGVAYPHYDFDHPGGSAVYSSVHDLLRFALFHLKEHLPDQRAIVPDAAIDAMQVPTGRRGDTRGYGIGWAVDEDERGYRTIGHHGGMGGVNTTLVMVPSERIAVVALANAAGDLPHRVAADILGLLLPRYAERLAEEQKQGKEENAKKEQATFKPPRKLQGEWRGSVHTYAGDVPLVLRFKKDGDVHARLGKQLTALVNDPTFEDERIGGVMIGALPTEDVNRRRLDLRLDLRLRGRTIDGALVAHTDNDEEGGAPGQRVGNGLSHWTELRKA
ncbi:MAG TPA: serine hydrolase domain-containing protein [Herpetosiphonaceae bacterium]|nr:serine hydrolase domain-containing protein [Herpetosiphonaceae bacterium]